MTPTVEKARKQLRERMRAENLNLRKDFWVYTEDRCWWEVQVSQLGLRAWVYADDTAHAKNKAAVHWFISELTSGAAPVANS